MTVQGRWVEFTLYHCNDACNCYQFRMKNCIEDRWDGEIVESPEDMQWELMVKEVCEVIDVLKDKWHITISNEVDNKILEYGIEMPCDFFSQVTVKEINFETKD